MSFYAIEVIVILLVVFRIHRIGCDPPEWTDHDISNLRLLQIVHRHGERTVLKDNMPKTDPFKDVDKYWSEGLGQLTNEGKLRMYKMGEYLRKSYQGYLGDEHSPREVYARSSVESRCIESLSCLLSGLYPPKNNWIWSDNGDPKLGEIWQPFPIETFIPKDEDTVLVPHKKCPKVDDEHKKISDSAKVRKIIDTFNSEDISKYLNGLFEDSINSLYRGQQFWDTLTIEKERGYIWPQLNGSGEYTQEQVIDRLKAFAIGSYVEDWNTDFIRTIRLGKLIEILINNMKNKLNGVIDNFDYKLYTYSTHDSIVCPLLQAFGIYNELYPPYGAAILIELHDKQGETKNESVVKVFYYNETLTHEPYLLMTQTLDDFEAYNKKYYYDDFNKMCGIETETKDNAIVSQMAFLVIGIVVGVALVGLNILAIRYIRSRRQSVCVSK